jgi:ATP:ADP antiporter, AAA family
VIDRYFYDVSTIVASLVLGLLVFIGLRTAASEIMSYIYIGLAVLASLVAIWSAFRLRAKYDESLLDWRLARSRRKSVLTGIEF